MRCGCCIELDTPQTIMDEGNRYYEPETDIFDEIFEGTDYANKTVMIQALWWKWRDYCIGGCDTPKWVRAMADRLGIVGHKWDAIISKAYDQDVDLTSLADRDYIRTIQRTAIQGTDGDVRVVTREGSDTNVNSMTGSDSELTEHESLPQTETDSTKYLDSRNTVTRTPSVETTDELTHDTTDTETYAPNNQEHEVFKADDSLTAVTFSEMMNNYPNVILGFVNEFSDYFIDRWY